MATAMMTSKDIIVALAEEDEVWGRHSLVYGYIFRIVVNEDS